MVERKEIVERAERTVSRMLGEGDQHAAAAIRELLEELVEETEAADNWRGLALQFDNHRMQALGHLKVVVNPGAVFDAYKAARAFLNAPPLDGEEVLAQQLAERAATPAADAGNPASKLSVPVGLPEPVPSGMCLVNAGALQMVINALRRDAEEGKVVRGEMADELLASSVKTQANDSDPLSDFQEGQWWVNELDAMASHPIGQKISITPDLKRSVSVVHNLLCALLAAMEQAQADALDAARYRFLRDTCWSSDKELATVISLQMNKVWDEKIDEAMARNKEE